MVFDVNYVVTFSIFDISRDPSDASAYTINFIIHISLYYIKFTKNSSWLKQKLLPYFLIPDLFIGL